MSYQTRRLTIIVLVLLTLALAGVSIFVAISLNNQDDTVSVVGGNLPEGAQCDPANDQCSGSLVCTPNTAGSDQIYVCNNPGSGGTCPGSETCGNRFLGFRCDTLTASGECFENRQEFSSFADALAYVGGCGQVDSVCSSTDQTCGSFQVVRDSCGPGEQNYACDSATNTCKAITDGEYSSLESCEEACAPKRYRCDTVTSTCVEGTTGNFSDMASCEEVCGFTPPRYSCDSQTYTCNQDPNGSFGTIGDCEASCVEEVNTYSCNPQNYTCSLDANGQYTSLASCQGECVAPKYSCDTDTYTCSQNPNGSYDSMSTCSEDCVPEVKFVCNTETFTCSQSTSGNFDTLDSCQEGCIPDFCGQPCGGKNGLTCPRNHSCDQTTGRCVIDACLNDPECTENGCKLPESAIFGDSRDYLIYAALLMIIGMILYKWNVFKLAFSSAEVVSEFNSSLSQSVEQSRIDKEQRKLEKEREKFESRFKNR